MIVYVISLLPETVLHAFFRGAWFVSYYLLQYRQNVIVQNLARSFPSYGYKDTARIAKKNSKHLFALFPQWLKQISISRKTYLKKIKIQNPELLEEISKDDRNCLLVLGHYGNWEYLAALPLFVEKPVYALYKKQRSSVSDFLSVKWRNRFGVRLLESSEAARFMIKHKDQPAIYIQIADQRPPKPTGESFSFMNQKTWAIQGIQRLQPKLNARVCYLEIMPDESKTGSYIFSLREITETKEITNRFFECLTDTIEKKPDYWLWSHKRWKRYKNQDQL